MSKGKKAHRGKRGGRRAFLKSLKKELNLCTNFDPEKAFPKANLTPLPPPGETNNYPANTVPGRTSAPARVPRAAAPVKRRVARARETFVPTRRPTRPLPIYLTARKPAKRRPLPKILEDIIVPLSVAKLPSRDFLIKNTWEK